MLKTVSNWIENIKNKWDLALSWIKGIKNQWRFYCALLVVGILGTWFTYYHAPAISDYFIVLIFALIFFAIFDWYDKKVQDEADTMDEILNQKNIAYAGLLIARALIVLAAAVTVS